MNHYDTILECFKQRVNEGRLAKTIGTAALAGVLGYGAAKMDLGRKQIDNITQSTQQTNPDVRIENISQNGINFIKGYEKLVLHPYNDSDPRAKKIDTWTDGATIGYGHLIKRNEWELYKNGITEEQADTLLESDLQWAVDVVKKTIKVKTTQNQFDMLVSLAFNIGGPKFTQSSIVKLLNGEPGADIPDKKTAWLAWNKSKGVISNGLNARRAAEWKIFES